MLAYHNTNIYLHEISLRTETSPRSTPMSPTHGVNSYSHVRLNLLLSCLEATKSCLDYILQLPRELCSKNTTQEMGYLAHAITVLIKLAFCKHVGLDSTSLREACNVSYYVDAISVHVASTSRETEDGQPDSVSAQRAVGERLKSWYERAEIFEQAGTPEDLKDMSPLQFVEIAKEEQLMNFDFGDVDFSFLDGPSFWN